jgi:hypothetical protein
MRKLKYSLIKLIVKLFGDIQFMGWAPFWVILWGDTHYKVSGAEERVVMGKLRKGDILVRRYDRYVSGWFIPGWWTHVGLYVGGGEVIHAVTKGVVKEDVMTFMRTDHLAVLRMSLRKGVRDNAAQLATEVIGKDYDFLFETQDDERMYCSELVRYSYPGVLEDDLGEGTIPPDRFFEVKGVKVVHDSREWRKEQDG